MMGKTVRHEKLNNKGFTLIELIVSILVMSMVMIAAVGFLIAAMNSYRINDIEVRLQTEAQEAMDHLDDILIEAKSYTYSQVDKRLSVVTSETTYWFELDSTKNRINYWTAKNGNTSMLAQYVTDFKVTPSTKPGKDAANQLVTLEITFEYAGKVYETTHIISMRNEAVD